MGDVNYGYCLNVLSAPQKYHVNVVNTFYNIDEP